MLNNLKVGHFEIKDGAIWGPEKYMKKQGKRLFTKILAGKDTIFNTCAHQSPTVEYAILHRLGIDYAGWRGINEAMSWLEGSDMGSKAARKGGK